MAKKITQSDISDDNVFGKIGESAEKNIVKLEALNKELVKVSVTLAETLKATEKNSEKSINSFVAESKALNELTSKVVQNNKTISDAQKLKEKARLEEIRLEKAREKSIDDYNKKLEQQKKAQQSAEQSLQKQREKSLNEIANTEKRVLAESEKANKKAKLEQQKAEQSLQRQREKSLAQMEHEKRKTEEANRPYNKLSSTLNELRKKYKDLAVAGNENSTEARKMKREIDSLDKTLKRVDGSVGQFQRNVGNYSSAFSKFSGVLAMFGGGLGVASVFNIIKNFDQGITNLASVIGKSREQIVELEKDAKRLGATTAFTATQVAELQTELAKLGFTETEILASTEAVLQLSQATGTDLARSAEVAGSTLRGFGLDASEMQRVVDVMAKSFSTSALDTEKFAESMKIVAPIAKSAGVSIEETTAMLGSLANAGISGSNAGTALRRILAEIATTGKPTSEALKELSERGLDLAGAEDEVGKNAMSALLILAENDKKTKELTETYQDAEGSAKQMADTQINTLGGAIALLTSAFEGYVLGVNDASGASNGLKDSIKFVADNFDLIMKVLTRLIGIYAILIIRQKVLNSGMIEFAKNLFTANKELTNGASNSQKFGNALKGIGWSVAIGLALELGRAIWNYADGTMEANLQMEQFEKINKRLSETVGNVLDKTNKSIEAQRLSIREQLAEGKISQKVADARMKQLDEINKLNLRNVRVKLDSLKAEAKAELEQLEAQRKNTNQFLNPLEYGRLTAQIIDRKGAIKAINKQLKSVISTQETNSIQLREEAVLTKEANKQTKERNTNIKEQKSYIKDLIDVENELIELEKKRLDSIEARKIELGEGIESARLKMLDYERSEQENEIQRVREQYSRLLTLAEEFGYGMEELTEAMNNDINDINVRYAQEDLLRIEDENKKKLEKEKEFYDEIKKFARQTADETINQMKRESQQRESEFDRRISAEKDLQNQLQAMANAGNIQAQQSILASQQAEQKATIEKQKEQQKQQRLEEISLLMKAIQQNVDNGDSIPVALGKAGAQVGLVKAFTKIFGNIKGFFEGTEGTLADENTPLKGGKDGHLIWADGNEKIMKGEYVKKLANAGLTKTSDIVSSAIMYQNIATKGGQVGYSIDLGSVVNELKDLKQTIKNKPETTISPLIIEGMAKGVVETHKQGNITRLNKYLS